MSHEFAEVYSVRASSPFLPCTRGLCCGSSCGNFRPPYTRADSEIAAPACILAYMGKKEKGKKKVWEEESKKRLADHKVTRGKKETGNYAEGKILMRTENITTSDCGVGSQNVLLRRQVLFPYSDYSLTLGELMFSTVWLNGGFC